MGRAVAGSSDDVKSVASITTSISSSSRAAFLWDGGRGRPISADDDVEMVVVSSGDMGKTASRDHHCDG